MFKELLEKTQKINEINTRELQREVTRKIKSFGGKVSKVGRNSNFPEGIILTLDFGRTFDYDNEEDREFVDDAVVSNLNADEGDSVGHYNNRDEDVEYIVDFGVENKSEVTIPQELEKVFSKFGEIENVNSINTQEGFTDVFMVGTSRFMPDIWEDMITNLTKQFKLISQPNTIKLPNLYSIFDAGKYIVHVRQGGAFSVFVSFKAK